MGFPGGSVVKNQPAIQETLVWSLSQEDPLQYCLGNLMDRGVQHATVHGVARVRHDLVTKQQQQYVHNTFIYNI